MSYFVISNMIIVASVSGSGATQHAGEDYTLTCTVSGGETTATTTYQWHRDNSPLSGETSATLSFTPLRQTTPSSNGQYVCEAMRSGRTARSVGFTITVIGKFDQSWTLCIRIFYSVPPLTLSITSDESPIEGENYSLTCELTGDESLGVTESRFRWDRLSPTRMEGILRAATLTFTPLTRDDEGQYRCTNTISSTYAGSQTIESRQEP